ncbi:MAG: NAD+ synthase [Gammaproteobacteria bacterium]|nr:NAD+ synthase [Gammaproteobacteria bacterium]
MANKFTVALAQMNVVVGDIPGNTELICTAVVEACARHAADLVVFPELAVCGYPPEDLLFQAGLQQRIGPALEKIKASTAASPITVLVGYPEYEDSAIYNSAALFAGGKQVANYRKQILPNYSVFDEERYFVPGNRPVVATVNGVRVGLAVCEDVWEPGPGASLADAGAQLIVSIHGSPFKRGKQVLRESIMQKRCRETGLPMVYANMVGGQDELVFDGGSAVFAADGTVTLRGPDFADGLFIADFEVAGDSVVPVAGDIESLPGDEESIYSALVMGVHDYVKKNGFPGVVIGLSGGIDSALTLAIAVDALGAEAVQAVMMPYRYTADISIADAQDQAQRLGVDYRTLPIESMVSVTNETLAELFANLPEDTTEENIQSRCRGLLLMAISNKTGRMVLATGNKSEMAVGYATLYGDMNGGFAPIKDCTKTLVYQLARYRNSLGDVIPERVITREPSAELAPDQRDSDSLPPYEVLDPILDALMLENCSSGDIVVRGFDPDIVEQIVAIVRRNEYKRRQAAPGVRISARAFGRDWRYPITSGYR